MLILIIAAPPARCQEEIESFNQQIWLDFNPKVVLKNSKFVLYGNLGYRTLVQINWNRYYINSGISFSPFIHNDSYGTALKYLQFHVGIADFYTAIIDEANLNELRTYQGLRFRWPSLKRVNFSHYFRFEQRFESLSNTKTREFTTRFRYQLKAKFRLLKPTLQDLYFPVSAELFMSSGEGLFFNDVTRLTPGVGYDFTDLFAMEFHISYHFSRNSSEEDFLNNELVYRLRAYYTF